MSSMYVQPLLLGSTLMVPSQTELIMNTHTMVVDIHRNALMGQEGADSQHHLVIMTLHSLTTEC